MWGYMSPPTPPVAVGEKTQLGFLKTGFAVFVGIIGVFASGGARQLGVFKYLDEHGSHVPMLLGRGTGIGTFPLLHAEKDWRFKHDTVADGALKGKLYLVTGANVGLGYWTAHYLAKKGGRVVLACRSEKKCIQAVDDIKTDLPQVTSAQLEIGLVDLASFQSIKTFAEGFIKAHPKLDSLILNAGLGFSTSHSLTVDGIENVMGVNHFGHFFLTQLLLPVVEAAGTGATPSTIVAVSSVMHFSASKADADRMTTLDGINDGSSGKPQYSISKGANILFSRELSARLTVRSANVLANAINPGAVQTDFYRGMLDSIHSTYPSWLAPSLVALFQSGLGSVAWHPRDAALTQIACAVAPDLIHEKVTGKYFHPMFREVVPMEYVRDPTRQKTFWAMSERVIADATKGLK